MERDRAKKGHVLIVGSGIGGYSAAKAIKRAGAATAVTVVSEESVPTYSACVLADYVAGDIPREKVFLKGRDEISFEKGELLLGKRAVALDLTEKRLHLERGMEVPFDRIVLATGSRPHVPDIPGVDRAGVYTLKTLADADALIRAQGSEAVIVGSGPVGLEAAAALCRRGWKVSVVEILDRLLPRVFAEYQSGMIRSLLERHGIEVYTRERVVEIAGTHSVEAVVTDKRVLPCHLVIVVAGMKPETSLAAGAGIRLGLSGGILVDEYMRTSCDEVFACGDCVESIDLLSGKPGLNMLWSNAKLQGMVAGINSLGGSKPYAGALNITTLTLCGTMATSVGEVELPDERFREILRCQGDRYSIRLVVRDGLIKGIQAVGPRIDISIFLRMMLSGERLTILSESKYIWSVLKQKPWLVRLPAYLRQ